jgi:hypothetical protein
MFKLTSLLMFLMPFAVAAQSVTNTIPELPRVSDKTAGEVLTTQPPDRTTDESGLLSYVDFNGNTNDTGHIFTTGFSAGYQFNRHVSVDAYVPFYYVSASTETTDANGITQSTTTTDSGLGDPSFSLMLRLPNRILNYKTRVTTWVPVADVNSGFTSGSVLVDWTSHLSRPVGRWLPYGQIGMGNTVAESPLFLLPYTAQGFNARFEAGSNIMLTKIFAAGASFYYVLPSGSQTIYSREFHGYGMGSGGNGAGAAAMSYGQGSGSGGGTGSGGSGQNGGGNGNRYGFMTQQVTEGEDITRDNGLGTWLTADLPHGIDLQIGFNRSFGYDLNTVSFGVGFDPLRAFNRGH